MANVPEAKIDLAALETEIQVGGPEEYMAEMLSEVDRMEFVMNACWVAARRFTSHVHAPLGAYAGSPAPTQSESVNISMFNGKLADDAESVVSVGLTKTAFTATGGNTGTGEVVECNVDPDGIQLEAGHNEEIRLECTSIQAGQRAAFTITGGDVPFFHFDPNMGTGNTGRGNAFDYGANKHDLTRATAQVKTSNEPQLVSWGASDQRNMITNGSFEAELGGGTTDKILGCTIDANHANVTVDTTTPINGLQSMRITGNVEMEFPCVGNIVGRPEFFKFNTRRRGTITGTLNVFLRSDVAGVATDHAGSTLAITVGGLVADTLNTHKLGYIVPAALGSDPRVVVQYTTSGGAGSLEFDDLIHGALTLFDGNRAIAVFDGVTPFKRGDGFDGENAYAAVTPFQRMFIELFGRSVKHSGGGSYWTP
jgi:hypothetical protein